MQTQTAIASVTGEGIKTPSLFQRIWPTAVIIFGLAITAAWIGLLGFSLIWIIKAAV
jgi:uncharacterized protein (DUF697 family)